MTIISKESLDKIRQERVPREDEVDIDIDQLRQLDEAQKEKQRDEEASSQVGSFNSFKPKDKH